MPYAAIYILNFVDEYVRPISREMCINSAILKSQCTE